MRTKIIALLVLSVIAVCSCSKKQGCTNIHSLVYDPSAEEDDGTCTYISGSYAMTQDCFSTDHFTMIIAGDSIMTFNNFANRFDNISGLRTGLTFSVAAKHGVTDRDGKQWDFSGGGGVISSDGKSLTLSSYSINDAPYQNIVGTISCTASGVK